MSTRGEGVNPLGVVLGIAMLAMPVTAILYTQCNPKQPSRSFQDIKNDMDREKEQNREIDVRWPGFRKDQEKLNKLQSELESAEKKGDSARAESLRREIQQLVDKWRNK